MNGLTGQQHHRSRPPMHWLVILVALWAVGCEDGESGKVATVQDSAGVAIASNPRAALLTAPEWSISETPTWSVGAAEGDSLEVLFQVEDAATISSDRVAILTQEGIRLHDRTGSFLGRIGRPGEGPGEFVRAFDLIVAGDSLIVFDWPQQRITVFREDGELIAVVTVDKPLYHPGLLSVFVDGSFVLKEDLWLGRPEQLTPIDRQYIRISYEGTLVDTIARHPYGKIIWIPQVGVRTIEMFGATAFSTGGRNGIWATTGGPEAAFYDHAGAVRRIVRWETEDRTVTEQDVEEHIQRSLEAASEGAREAVRTRWQNTPVAAERPAARGILLGSDGKLWVEEYRPWSSTVSARWMVFDSTGVIVAWVTLPPQATLYEAGRDYVLLEVVDELGVEQVREYSLQTDRQ